MAITIQAHNAATIKKWLDNQGGVCVWQSVDLSDPGKQMFTPVILSTGEKASKPGWQFASEPAEIIKSADDVNVVKPKEVKRFRIALRMGAQGFKLKLTDGSTNKVRRACEKYGEDSWYEFDYDNQEAVIFVPGQKFTLNGYLNNEN